MENHWLKLSPSLNKGIASLNHLEDTKFEQFLRRIVAKMKLLDTEIFTNEERQKLEKIFKTDEEHLLLAIKTILYLFKRMLKFIFMPADLKNDLVKAGVHNAKADSIIKIWSTETRTVLDELSPETIDKYGNSLDFSWKLSAELSSDICKKSKVPKAYLSFNGDIGSAELELTHSELYNVFQQFEIIQSELDNLM